MEFGVHGLNILLAIKCAGTEITPERGYVTVLKTNMVANHVPDLIQMTWKNVISNHVHVIYMYICYFVWKDTLNKLAKNTCVVTSCVCFILSFFSKCKSDFCFNVIITFFFADSFYQKPWENDVPGQKLLIFNNIYFPYHISNRKGGFIRY